MSIPSVSGSSMPIGSEIVTVVYRVRVPRDVVQKLADQVAVDHDYADEETRGEYLDEAICKWVEDSLPDVLADRGEGQPDVEI